MDKLPSVPTNELVRMFIHERVSSMGGFYGLQVNNLKLNFNFTGSERNKMRRRFTEKGELCRTSVGGAAVGDCIERSKSDSIKWPDSCSRMSIERERLLNE